MTQHKLDSFDRLIEIMAQLRDKCPWDKSQTHQSLTPYAIEEIYELVEAIEGGDDIQIQEELGDVLFQVVFHAAVAEEQKRFSISHVIEGICSKLVRRHPHVFSDTQVSDTEEVIKNWNAIKKDEKQKKIEKGRGQLSGSIENKIFDVPPALPALQRAQKIGDKTKQLKFDWKSHEEVWLKVQEELAELEDAIHSQNKREIEHEIGDVFFTLVHLARHLGIDSEQSLRKTNQRFVSRFQNMLKLSAGVESISEVSSDSIEKFVELNPNEKEVFWHKAKLLEIATGKK